MSTVLFRPLGVNASYRAMRTQRKREIKEINSLVKFAERYDPMRKMRNTFCGTLKKLGWPHKRDDNITEGVVVLASLNDKFVAYDVAPVGQYSFAAPPTTNLDLVEKLVLSPALQAKNDVLLARGWKVVWLPQEKWMDALAAKRQHDVRFNLLLDLTLAHSPFSKRL